MYHYVYEITNLINGKKYIGKRSCHCLIEDDKYMGSGKILKKSQKKYGLENFKKEILEVCKTEKEAFIREKFYINRVKAYKNTMYYNIAAGGEGGNVRAGFTEEKLKKWKSNMSKSHKGKKGHPSPLKGIRKKPPTAVKSVKINEFVWRDWLEFTKDLTFSKSDLISQALKEFMENHK